MGLSVTDSDNNFFALASHKFKEIANSTISDLKNYNIFSKVKNYLSSDREISLSEIMGFSSSSEKKITTGSNNVSHKFRATVKDLELLRKRDANFDVNNPDGKAQFVVGDEDGEVKVTCDYDIHSNDALVTAPLSQYDSHRCRNRLDFQFPFDNYTAPGFIEITDNTNGKKNTYRYIRLTQEQKEKGEFNPSFESSGKVVNRYLNRLGDKTFMTKPYYFSSEQFKQGKDYYILVSVCDEHGNNLELADHSEIYELNYSYDKNSDTYNYDLVQDAGMDGAGKSSMKYDLRK